MCVRCCVNLRSYTLTSNNNDDDNDTNNDSNNTKSTTTTTNNVCNCALTVLGKGF